MVETVALTAGDARLEVIPPLGGGVARLDVAGLPVLWPFEGKQDDVFSLASNTLVPFSNRISGGGFTWRRREFSVAPNLPGERYPIHGDGFQKPWAWSRDEGRLVLRLEEGSLGPWRYRAVQTMELRPQGCTISLDVTNVGEIALPFGGGFHPWFPRSPATRLSFDAKAVWLEDETYLPTECQPLSENPDWRYDQPRGLPRSWINNCFTDWTGVARITQGADAVSCTLTANENIDFAMVFSPGEDAGFFCFEPVSHPVDAHNLPGAPGLRELASGESMTMSFSLDWDP